MQARAVNPRDEVMVSVDGDAPIHAYIVSQLKKKNATGDPLFLVRDDLGVSRIVHASGMFRPTTEPILVAEQHIHSVLKDLVLRCYGESEEWMLPCIQRLDKALYELSKPEATRG